MHAYIYPKIQATSLSSHLYVVLEDLRLKFSLACRVQRFFFHDLPLISQRLVHDEYAIFNYFRPTGPVAYILSEFIAILHRRTHRQALATYLNMLAPVHSRCLCYPADVLDPAWSRLLC